MLSLADKVVVLLFVVPSVEVVGGALGVGTDHCKSGRHRLRRDILAFVESGKVNGDDHHLVGSQSPEVSKWISYSSEIYRRLSSDVRAS